MDLGVADGAHHSGLDRVRPSIAAPRAAKRPTTTIVHHDGELDDILTDDYAWLRDDDLRNDTGEIAELHARLTPDQAEVVAHITAENDYAERVMRHTAGLRSTLYREMVGRVKLADESVPTRDGDYFYYVRLEETSNYPIHCRRHLSLDAPEEVILDENALAKGHGHHQLDDFAVSPDGRYVAYAKNNTGADTYTLHIRDLSTGLELTDAVDGISPNIEWAKDGSSLFYTRPDESQRPYLVMRHRLGTNQDADAVLYTETDTEFLVAIGKTHSERFLVIESASQDTTEDRVLDLDDPNAQFKLVAPRVDKVQYSVEDHGDRFLIHTDLDAKNFRVVQAPIADPRPENWTDVIPHDPAVNIAGVTAYRDHLVMEERTNGLSRIHVRKISTGEDHFIDFPEAAYSVGAIHLPGFESNILRFAYTSLVTPSSVFDYNMDTRERVLRKQQVVVGGYNPALYTTERVFAPAADGVTQIPIILVRKKTTLQSAYRPLKLIGYGAYGHPYDPAFSSATLSLLNRGVTIAIAQIRGGGELGEEWHDAGKMRHKMNTFTDFIDSAKFLRHAGYASPRAIAADARSAGGLLVGVCANLRPDLFCAIVAGVPFVDVMNTMLDESIPLTTGEFLEWGNPKDKGDFDYMRAYSPYDNVRAQDYPHMLVTAGLHDPRVGYWEPAKWVAKLRDMKTDRNQIILKTFMGGHTGTPGRFGRLKDAAYEEAFILDSFGLARTRPTPSE